MGPKPKGKAQTKGQKQIVQENKETLLFYTQIMAASMLIYFIIRIFWFLESCWWWTWVVVVGTAGVFFGCYKMMEMMSKPSYSPTGDLLDGGMDLNAGEGTAEHIKDVILLTAIVQFLSIFSEYFWFLWLLAPGRAFYLLWFNILSPWIFAPDQEVDEKKQRKMERKMARRH